MEPLKRLIVRVMTGGGPVAARRRHHIGKVGKFLLAGLPAFIVAVPLNVVLVELIGMPKPLAYALVMAAQVTLNFFMCRWFVFEKSVVKSVLQQYITYISAIAGVRLLELTVYTLLVNGLHFNYLLVQISNVIIFALLKYKLGQRAIEDAKPAA